MGDWRPRGTKTRAGWRTAYPGRGAPQPEQGSPAALLVCVLLASGYGRGLRMVVGGLLISAGAAAGGGVVTTVLASLGLGAMLEALFDLCLAAPLFGCPQDGTEIRRRAQLLL